MSHTVTATHTTLRQGVRPHRQKSSESVCLLLAANAGRRAGLSKAAKSAGWRVLECDSATEATRQHQRWLTQLTAIDLGATAESVRKACQQFAESIRQSDRLLLIYDEPGSPETEVWARQNGAWAYVPSPEFNDGLVELFAEALTAAAKSGPSAVAR
ncbi:hypothetical protein [Botrimarina sp.]|uniref:hypothetical protein n=1 Tax=Botrimarina sp. TaxID=2795802 RepID=UPI0032ED6CFB